jgi:hypothetical protein
LSDKLEQIITSYFADLRDKHGLGAGTPERSYYPAVAKLFDAIGEQLKPMVLCLSDLGNTGAGQPDFGLYVANQVQKGAPRKGQVPERGVIEMKPVKDDAWLTADTKQVSKYWEAYRLVIVTNLRDFLILGEDQQGRVARLETFRLAKSEVEFWEMVATPQSTAMQVGRAFGEYLRRALTQSVALREPKDVAWFLASYARDALQRVEEAGDLPALASVRSSLEEALGVTFESDKGEHFFRSTLVQTLFYGVFSAWVLWARSTPRPSPHFDWHTSAWYLNVPFVTTLFQQLASPAQLQPLHLVELLDWTAVTLNRVNSEDFISRFNDADAVQFFYEPFLEAFDPELRKELGVWYTPTEVITYMVARVDRALREELGVADGLASEQVYVLDPCCGTGGYLTAVLRRIDVILTDRGLGALKAQMVKKAATTRVFGFEILPAPFIVAHLKIGLVLKSLGATLEADNERVGVYLTNALTGWEPVSAKPLPFPELEEERKKADHVKQEAPILVILGNPPYNGYAGMAQELPEERSLSLAYRTTRKVRLPEGQGLNDLYVRFYRMAERRITEKTGRGVVCFISNYSWLDGLSFTGMRERYLEAFDAIRIDCLNGDKFRTGKTTPEGLPDPSIFSTEHNREGIQVGTAIATLVRKHTHIPTSTIDFRDLWGATKRKQLLDTADTHCADIYKQVAPSIDLGLPFRPNKVASAYFRWPSIKSLFPATFSGVQTRRDAFLVSTERSTIKRRTHDYLDPKIDNDAFFRAYPYAAEKTAQYDPKETRNQLLNDGAHHGSIVEYFYRPFDVRYCFWTDEAGLLGRPVAEYVEALPSNTRQLVIPRAQRRDFSVPMIASILGDLNAMDGGASYIPQFIKHHRDAQGHRETDLNLPRSLSEHCERNGMDASQIFLHVLAIMHSPQYAKENGEAMRSDWPRVPIPNTADQLQSSTVVADTLAALIDPQASVTGVTCGSLRAGLRNLGVPHKQGAQPIEGADLALTAGWGHIQQNRTGSILVMPGNGLVSLREYTSAERAALSAEAKELGIAADAAFELLGYQTLDVHLNAKVLWTNVPVNVWDYALGGYQVIKKWLSYREAAILGRALKPDEVAYVSEMVRRIAAILLLSAALDANYAASKADAVEWKDSRPVAR